LSSIRSVTGKPAVDLKLSMLQEGDKVTVEYKSKTYQGEVKAPRAGRSIHSEPDQQHLENLPLAGLKRSPRKRRPSELLGTTPEKKAKKSAKKTGKSEPS